MATNTPDRPISAPSGLKRAYGTPTGTTPSTRAKRRHIRGRKLDFDSEEAPRSKNNPWVDKEILALVKFILLYCGDKWTATKDLRFWSKSATFIKSMTKSSIERTGKCFAS